MLRPRTTFESLLGIKNIKVPDSKMFSIKKSMAAARSFSKKMAKKAKIKTAINPSNSQEKAISILGACNSSKKGEKFKAVLTIFRSMMTRK